MPKSKPKSVIAEQERIRRKMRDANLNEQYWCADVNPTLRTLHRRYRAAERLLDLSRELWLSIGSQIVELKKARKKCTKN